MLPQKRFGNVLSLEPDFSSQSHEREISDAKTRLLKIEQRAEPPRHETLHLATRRTR